MQTESFQAIQDEDESQRRLLRASLEDELTQDIDTPSSPINEKSKSGVSNEVTGQTARQLVASGNYKAAIEFYTARIKKSPSDHLLFAGRSKAKFLSGDRLGAIEDIEIAINRVPLDARLKRLKEQYVEGNVSVPVPDLWQFANKGNDLLREGKAEESFGAYSKAQELGLTFGSATFNKAMARVLSNDSDGANYFLDQSQIIPASPMECNILGLKAIIAAVSNTAPIKSLKELKEKLDCKESFNFDFNQSQLRHLELGFIARYGQLSSALQKVFDALKGN